MVHSGSEAPGPEEVDTVQVGNVDSPWGENHQKTKKQMNKHNKQTNKQKIMTISDVYKKILIQMCKVPLKTKIAGFQNTVVNYCFSIM